MAPPRDDDDDDDDDLAQFVRDLLRDDDDDGRGRSGRGHHHHHHRHHDDDDDRRRRNGFERVGGYARGCASEGVSDGGVDRGGGGDRAGLAAAAAVATTTRDHVAGTWATPRAGGGFGISDDVVEVGSEGASRAVEVTTTLSALQSTTTTTTNTLSTKPMEPTELTNKRPGEFAAPRGRRKRKSIFPEDVHDFGLERLTHMLMLPAHEAAAKLGVSGTTFKHRYGVIRMRGYCLNFVARARRLARGQRNLTNGCVFLRR